MAAFPVSPDVAVRITVSLSSPVCFFAARISWGSMERATSLNADVGPRNSSRTYLSPTFTTGVRSFVSNLPSYALFTRPFISLKSGSRCDRIFSAMLSVSRPMTAFQSKPFPISLSDTNRPPSGAMPFRTASRLLHLNSDRVLL